MAEQPESFNESDSSQDLGEICDLCWDDDHKEVPSVKVIVGVPMCSVHADNMTQKRFAEKIEPSGEAMMSIPKTPRRPADISPVQMEARRNSMKEAPKSLEIFKPGGTEDEFARGLGSLMQDVIAGRVSPEQTNAACNVADRVIRIIEMRIKQDWRENGGG